MCEAAWWEANCLQLVFQKEAQLLLSDLSPCFSLGATEIKWQAQTVHRGSHTTNTRCEAAWREADRLQLVHEKEAQRLLVEAVLLLHHKGAVEAKGQPQHQVLGPIQQIEHH